VKGLPRAVLVDLDDTILDDSSCVEGCWADACAEAGIRTSGLDVAALRAEIRSHADQWWRDMSRNQRGRLDLRAATREIVREVFERLGYDGALAADVANHYRDLREERVTAFPGAIETLAWLREYHVRLGLMTNGSSSGQRAKIERFGLAQYFDHILIEGEFGCGKPDPKVFSCLLAALGAQGDEAWAVGDNIEADVFGAMDAGIHGIWVDAAGRGLREAAARRPDRVVAALSDLMNGGNDG
jgi:putative hydrolase of the HAD superfamily